MKTTILFRCLIALVLGTLMLGTGLPVYAGDGVDPIPPGPVTVLPEYIGAAVKAHPLPPNRVPQNPSLGPNPFNHDHNDSWMSDTYNIAGPLGREPQVLTNRMVEARRNPDSTIFHCPGTTADSHGRLVLSCDGVGEWSLVLVDPVTLEVLAYKHLPLTNLQTALSASYLYIDNQDRAVIMVPHEVDDQMVVKIQLYRQTGLPGDLGFALDAEYDLTEYVPKGDKINGVLPDWQGRIWFVVRNLASVGVVDPATGTVVDFLQLEGKITNSFAMTRDAAYIVTTKYMYRIELGPDGALHVIWQAPYQNINTQKPGQLSAGSGTTPTILGNGRYVAIADNAEQMHVTVFRTEPQLNPADQLLCEVPVFKKGKAADENSLIGTGLSMIAYNAYGYDIAQVYEKGMSMHNEPGIARVDIDPDGKGCHLVWENDDVEFTDSVAKLSTWTGLVYAVTRKYDKTVPGHGNFGHDVYYFSAIDFRTGEVVWERQIGTGIAYDAWADLVIGLNGTAYLLEFGGLVTVRDTR